MRLTAAITVLSVLLLLVCSCADSTRFVVNGTTPGTDNMNLRFGYDSPSGYRSGVVAVRDGKFEFSGESQVPTLVEMYEHDYTPLGQLYLVNGDKVECVVTRGKPEAIKISGTPVNERWAKFLNSNTGVLRTPDCDSVIAAYVTAHPDDILSTLLLMTQYDARRNPAGADSLLSKIHPSARPEFLAGSFSYLLSRAYHEGTLAPVDSITYISTSNTVDALSPEGRKATVYLFTADETQRTDSIVKALVRLSKLRGVAVADIFLSPDTLTWRRMIRNERLSGVDGTWRRGWLPGNIGAPQLQALGVTSLPFALVCDSTGAQRFRGQDIRDAEKTVSTMD